jgi:hypothetical protein
MWGREAALSLLAEAGFGDLEIKEVDDDPLNLYYIAHR